MLLHRLVRTTLGRNCHHAIFLYGVKLKICVFKNNPAMLTLVTWTLLAVRTATMTNAFHPLSLTTYHTNKTRY